MIEKLSTGSDVLNKLVNNGYEKDIITTIYGPAAAGKTCACILASIAAIKCGKKVIYVDTEGGFSVERLKQITDDYKKVLENMVFFKPVSFEEQKKAFERLKDVINDKTGLVVVDTISMLYRLEMGKSNDVYGVNRELGQQISYLSEIARRKGIPILLTNQVYADFKDKSKVNIVGGDILKYGSKCMIEFKLLKKNMRCAVLVKHRSIESEKEEIFRIIDKGFEGVDTKHF